jgi:TfoX/Sxy family transcriptional regulator of competence genes
MNNCRQLQMTRNYTQTVIGTGIPTARRSTRSIFYLYLMAYSEALAKRIREVFSSLPNVEEKQMMGGLVFMYNGKMCVGIIKDEMLCRIDPAIKDELLKKPGCSEMAFTGRPMKSYVLVNGAVLKTKKQFEYWIDQALAFNPYAKASKK